MSDEANDLLMNYQWPGNIRQLKNCIEQAVFHADSNAILPEDLPKEIRSVQVLDTQKTVLSRTEKETLADVAS